MSSYDWINDTSRTFLERGYLLDGVTPEERVQQIADRAEEILGISGFADEFERYMSQGFYSLASPVWSNFGLDRGLPISCFGSYIDDTMESILYTHAEVGMMTKFGGGTSGYFGKVRPRGASITNNGKSNGTQPFAQLFETVMGVVSQGSTRRGYFAGYIDVEHPDIREWLKMRTEGSEIQEMLYGVVIGDEFMEGLLNGDTEKRELWAEIIQTRINTGAPYIIYRGNMNRGRPDVYKNQGLQVHASNLCLTGDQRVLSDRGYKRAEDLFEEGGRLTLFDGEKAIGSSRMKLRQTNADVWKFTLANGMEQKVTAEHGMAVYDGGGKFHREEAQNVEVGDRIVIQKKKGLFGDRDMQDEAFLLGLYQSDGTQNGKRRYIDIWESNFDLADEIDSRLDAVYNKYGFNEYELKNQDGETVGTRGRATPQLRDVKVNHSNAAKKRLGSSRLVELGFEKGSVPEWIWESNEETQWAYLRGLLYTDGTAYMSESKGNPIQIAYADVDREFLKELQLIFNNLGLSSQIRLLREGGKQELPDGKGGTAMYDTQDCYRLIVGNKNAAQVIEENTGFLSRKGIELEERAYRDNTKKAYEVVDIEYVGQETVYCPTTDTKESVFVSQGVLTFNCSEIALPSDPEESFVCCLSSMNLARYDSWKGTDAVRVLTYFLDSVMEEFIQEAKDVQFMGRAVRFARRHRAIGIGALGWHSYLLDHRIPFGSAEAMQKNAEIFKRIRRESYAASEELASLLGEPEVLDGYGRRNTTTMAVAPTQSSSIILGQVSPSIEPFKSNYFVRDSAKVKYTHRTSALEEVLEEHGKNTEAVWDDIAAHNGSVQHLDFLTDHERDVFRTFAEIPQIAIVRQAAQRQQYIDQAQSINLAIDPSVTPAKDISRLHIDAWQSGVKSLYYQKSVNAAQEFARELLTCEACSA